MKKFFPVALIAVVLGLTTVVIGERQARMSLRDDLRSLRLQMQELSEQVAQMQQEQQRAIRASPSTTDKPDGTAEIMRLRGEIGQLAAGLAELERANAAISNRIAAAQGSNIPFVYPDATKRKDYVLAGYSTPQSALQSALWAITQMDARTFLGSLTGREAEMHVQTFQDLPEGVMPGGFRNGMMFKASGFRVLEETPVSDEETLLKVFLEGSRVVIKPVFKKIDGEWKWSRNEH